MKTGFSQPRIHTLKSPLFDGANENGCAVLRCSDAKFRPTLFTVENAAQGTVIDRGGNRHTT
jgi:hypothetical protein